LFLRARLLQKNPPPQGWLYSLQVSRPYQRILAGAALVPAPRRRWLPPTFEGGSSGACAHLDRSDSSCVFKPYSPTSMSLIACARCPCWICAKGDENVQEAGKRRVYDRPHADGGPDFGGLPGL